jgi:ATP-dependent protease ClpP protease subunit
LITPHVDYRANPRRAIHVNGVIDRDLVSSITPQILTLQSDSREPITVYIDSPGGSVAHMEALLLLLRMSDQDSSGPCRIITAVINRAASAAADLLSSGDYAIAYPTSTILYHGVRRPAESLPPLTAEISSLLGHMLRLSNDQYAMELARKIEDRFSFRFMMVRGEFGELRTELGKPDLSDLDCFVAYISRRLSPEAKKVWDRARDRHTKYRSLFATILKKAAKGLGKSSRARFEANSIKAIVDFEVKAHKANPEWSFIRGGIGSLSDDLFLLNEYLSTAGHERLLNWSKKFGKYMLQPEVVADIEATADPDEQAKKLVEKVAPVLEPLWSFFVALCHALQNGENELTARDAYWLGLVDEVVGEKLFAIRHFMEFTPDPPTPDSPPQDGAELAPA